MSDRSNNDRPFVMKKLIVNALWDSEAKVWVATSEDVKGLVVESPDMYSLLSDLRDIIPVLMEENKQMEHVPVELLLSGRENIFRV